MSDDTHPPHADDTTAASSTAVTSTDDEHAPNTLLNALIGAVVGVLLSFIPLSTILGGAVAGYLEGGDTATGAKVGALAGLIALVPFVFVLVVATFFVPVLAGLGGGLGIPFAFWFIVFGVVVFGSIYVVGLSILGGIVGSYLKTEA